MKGGLRLEVDQSGLPDLLPTTVSLLTGHDTEENSNMIVTSIEDASLTGRLQSFLVLISSGRVKQKWSCNFVYNKWGLVARNSTSKARQMKVESIPLPWVAVGEP